MNKTDNIVSKAEKKAFNYLDSLCESKPASWEELKTQYISKEYQHNWLSKLPVIEVNEKSDKSPYSFDWEGLPHRFCLVRVIKGKYYHYYVNTGGCEYPKFAFRIA